MMTELVPNYTNRTALEDLADSERLYSLLCDYLEFCKDGKIPNIAGFCRFSGTAISEFEKLKQSRPHHYSALCAVLEDEALNSEMPASILSVYLKQRLGYSGEKPEESGISESGHLKLIFDHDAYKDGE